MGPRFLEPQDPKTVIWKIAQHYHERFLTDASGDPDRPETWIKHLAPLGVVCHGEYGGESSYCARDTEYPAGVIVYDCTMPTIIQARQIVHESGHHFVTWFPPKLKMEADRALAACGNKKYVEEAICCALEDLALPLPGHIQRNGKLAVPPSRPVIWVHRRIPEPPRENKCTPADTLL